MVPVDECSFGNKCQLLEGCSNVLVIKDAPLIVNANSTALVGVMTYIEAQCKCNTLTFDGCNAGSCLNGGTCQQLDNAFKSVYIYIFLDQELISYRYSSCCSSSCSSSASY